MEIPGPCYLCGDETLVRTCSMCGQSVCKAHFNFAASACIRCGRATPRGGGGPLPKEPPNLPEPEDIGGRFT